MKRTLFGILALGITGSSLGQFIGPSAYLQTSDSPWATLPSSYFTYFHLDNFETGALAAPGVSASSGLVIDENYTQGIFIDSVDGDAGGVNGSGNGGKSWYGDTGSVTWTFNAGVLGTLPTHAGIVWTDGANSITFEAWDENEDYLGFLQGNHADGSFLGETAEDRFYGIVHSGGISKIRLTNSGGIEMDHLQFGRQSAVPEPASLSVLGLGLAALLRKKRK